MREIKDKKLLKVFQVDNYEYNNYLVYYMENEDNYEVWLRNKNYGVMMFLYGVPKKQQTLEELVNNYIIDEYIQEYQEEYEADEEDFMEEKIKDLKKAKENVRWLLDNPTGLVDMHDIEYWAGVVKRLVNEIKEML